MKRQFAREKALLKQRRRRRWRRDLGQDQLTRRKRKLRCASIYTLFLLRIVRRTRTTHRRARARARVRGRVQGGQERNGTNDQAWVRRKNKTRQTRAESVRPPPVLSLSPFALSSDGQEREIEPPPVCTRAVRVYTCCTLTGEGKRKKARNLRHQKSPWLRAWRSCP